MHFFDIYPLVIAVAMVFLLGWLLPKNGKSYDVLQLRLDLFPSWYKWISALWALFAFVVYFVLFFSENGAEYFLISSVNFALFLFFFSKQKNEDEYSEQLRLKAFFYSFISFIGVVIILGAIGSNGLKLPFSQCLFTQLFLGIALIIAVVYFYFTLYKSNH